MEQAIAKLQTEMEQNRNHPYVQVIGGFLLNHLQANPSAAEQILAVDKTIKKSLDVMKDEAKKKQISGCAVLTDQEGFSIVLKYFGIDGEPAAPAAVPTTQPLPNEPKPQPAGAFSVSLDDLL